MPTALDAVIYTRVSQDKSGRKDSVDQQEAELRTFAAEEGWRVVEVFTDNHRSASEYSTKGRPGLDELERYIRANHVDVLAIWEASRLARSMQVAIYFRDLCRNTGVKIWYSEKLYDMANADDRKHFTDDMADAEHESAKISKRTLRAVRARARAGLPHGKQLFGYTRVYDEISRELVEIIEAGEQAQLLREMASRVLEGESCYGIAQDLNERGAPAPSGEGWHPTNVTRLLKNPAYAGKRVLQGKVVSDGNWPAIFDTATYDRLASILGDPARSTRREGGVRYLLTGIMICGVCGGRIGVIKQRGGYLAYCCVGKPGAKKSDQRFCTARKITDVDAWVELVVIERLGKPDAIAAFDRDDEAGVASINDELAGLRARLDAFYDSAARGEITPSALARIEGQLLAEVEKLEGQRRALAMPSVLRGLDLTSVEAAWNLWPLHTKRAIIRELFEIKLHPVGRGARRFDPATVSVRLYSEQSQPDD